MLIGNRIPKDYFIASGIGESDITVHAGSYDLAVREAGMHNYNHIKYSSIMPGIARRVERPTEYVHGSVAETIMAHADGVKGQKTTAGLIIGWLYEKKTGKRYGGLVAEYSGHDDEAVARAQLEASMKEMFESRYDHHTGDYDLKDLEAHIRGFVPQKRYGTCIVAIVFTSYEFPVLRKLI